MADIAQIIKKIRSLVTKEKEVTDVNDITITQNRMQKHRFVKLYSQKDNINDIIKKVTSKYNVEVPKSIIDIFNASRTSYTSIPEYYQAINIVLDNLLSPDSTSKETLNVIVNIPDVAQKEQYILSYQTIIDELGLEEVVSQDIALDFLLYGNSYVWIKTPYELMDLKVVKDSYYPNGIKNNYIFEDFTVKIANHNNDYKKHILSESYVRKLLESDKKDELKKKIKLNLKNIDIEVLDPKKVVPLYISNNFIGCLLINTAASPETATGIQKDMTNINNLSMELSKTIITSLSKNKKLDEISRSDYLISLMYSATSNLIKNNQIITGTYFIPDSNIVHFKIPSRIFHPFGEPFGMGSLMIAKYLIAADMSQLVYRLTRAAEKRIFKINVFDDNRSSQYIQEIINQTKRKEYAIRNANDTDTLLNEVTMFEDYYIPIYAGEETMSIDVQPGGDMTNRIEDLEYFRKKMISGFGIPAIYLIQDDTPESKYTLAQENIRFARTIIKLQKFFSDKLTELCHKIYAFAFSNNDENISSVSVQLKQPRSLQLERESEMIQNFSNVISQLREIAPESFNVDEFAKDMIQDIFGQSYFIKDKLTKLSSDVEKGNEGGEEVGTMGGTSTGGNDAFSF